MGKGSSWRRGQQLFPPKPSSLALAGMALAAALGCMPAAVAAVPDPAPAHRAGAATGDLLVRFRASAGPSRRAEVRRSVGATARRSLPVPGLQLVRPQGATAAARRAFERRPEVLYAEPDRWVQASAIPNDIRFGDLWGLNNTGQLIQGNPGTPDADIDAPEAWNVTQGSTAVPVAVVDTGMAYDHPDLAPNLWKNPGESGAGRETNAIDDDGDGKVDDFRGWDFVDNDNDPRDFDGHGSHVAGTIGARGNDGSGVAGVNWRVGLMPLRVLDGSGSGPLSNVIAGFGFAGAHGARVANASLGAAGFSQALDDVLADAPNTLFVVAAGNDGQDNDAQPQTPCDAEAPNLVCVAATDQLDGLAGFSNFGATSVDLGAPGTRILSDQPAYGLAKFADDFEGGTLNWLTGGTNNSWAQDSEAFSQGTQSLNDSPGANYQNNTDSFARSDPFDLSGEVGCRVTYQLQLDLKSIDHLLVEGSTDGSNWTEVEDNTGTTNSAFKPFDEDFSSFDGASQAFLRFRLKSNGNTTGDGAHIDEVKVHCLTSTYAGDEFAFLNGTSMATPHVAGVAALLAAHKPSATPAQLKSALLDGGDPDPALAGRTVSGRRLNARGALTALDNQGKPKPDRSPPALVLSSKRLQRAVRRGFVLVTARCPKEACRVRGTGSVSVPSQARVFKLRKASRSLSAGAKGKLKLRFTRAGRRAARRALARRVKLRARLRITATDLAGNAEVKRTAIKLRR